jgi:hypothetical protein
MIIKVLNDMQWMFAFIDKYFYFYICTLKMYMYINIYLFYISHTPKQILLNDGLTLLIVSFAIRIVTILRKFGFKQETN